MAGGVTLEISADEKKAIQSIRKMQSELKKVSNEQAKQKKTADRSAMSFRNIATTIGIAGAGMAVLNKAFEAFLERAQKADRALDNIVGKLREELGGRGQVELEPRFRQVLLQRANAQQPMAADIQQAQQFTTRFPGADIGQVSFAVRAQELASTVIGLGDEKTNAFAFALAVLMKRGVPGVVAQSVALQIIQKSGARAEEVAEVLGELAAKVGVDAMLQAVPYVVGFTAAGGMPSEMVTMIEGTNVAGGQTVSQRFQQIAREGSDEDRNIAAGIIASRADIATEAGEFERQLQEATWSGGRRLGFRLSAARDRRRTEALQTEGPDLMVAAARKAQAARLELGAQEQAEIPFNAPMTALLDVMRFVQDLRNRTTKPDADVIRETEDFLGLAPMRGEPAPITVEQAEQTRLLRDIRSNTQSGQMLKPSLGTVHEEQ